MRRGALTELLLAINIGTSGVKAGVFDTQGNLICLSRSPYSTTSPRPGWAEQSPQAWWAACADCVKEVSHSIDTSLLLGICVTGLAPAMVYLNEQGEATRRAPIWSDNRACAEHCEVIERTSGKSPSNLLSQVLWLKRNEPEVYKRVRWVLQSFEFINLKLTGEIASIAFRADRPRWIKADIESCGLNPDIFPQRICMPGALIGLLLPGIADQLRIPPGLPVIAGTVDTFSAWIGTATLSKGMVCDTVGTSSSLTLIWDEPLEDRAGRISCMPHITGFDWAVTGAMSNGAIVVDWFARQFYEGRVDAIKDMTAEAAVVPAGADGLISLPYLLGERSPILDPLARGVFFGVSQAHTRAHFARAVLESIAFGARHVSEAIQEVGGEIGEVRLAGSIARNDLWCQIMSDMLGQPVLIPGVADSDLLGAAIVAGWGVGSFDGLKQAAQLMVKYRHRAEPSTANHARYSQMFEVYKSIYARLKEVFAASASLNADAG